MIVVHPSSPTSKSTRFTPAYTVTRRLTREWRVCTGSVAKTARTGPFSTQRQVGSVVLALPRHVFTHDTSTGLPVWCVALALRA